MAYTPDVFADDEAGNTPITAEKLNRLGVGLQVTAGVADAAETPTGAQSKADAAQAAAVVVATADATAKANAARAAAEATAAAALTAGLAGKANTADITALDGRVDVLEAAPTGTSALSVQDEDGTALTGVTLLDFRGAGVTAAAGATGEVVVTIPGGGSSAPSTSRNALTGLWHLGGYTGYDPTGAADQTALLQSVVDEVAAAGGGTIYIGPQTAGKTLLKIAGTVIWKSRVSLKGSDRSQVALVGTGTGAVIRAAIGDGTSASTPITDVDFSDFEIDGAAQTAPGGTYSSATKGIFIQHMKRVSFRRLHVHDTAATGLGVDHLYEGCVFHDNVVMNCGRLNDGTGPGGSGIGLGTAQTTDDEPFTVHGNYCVGNKRYGIFVEAQDVSGTGTFATFTRGGRITDNYVRTSQVGIGDSGQRNLLIAHNDVQLCTTAGIAVDYGSFTKGRPGYDGVIADNMIYRNAVGILLDYSGTTATTYPGHYTVRDNEVVDTTNEGVKILLRAAAVTALQILNNIIHGSGRSGIYVAYSGSTPTASLAKSTIRGNVCFSNGTSATAGNRDGIRIVIPIADTVIVDNRCFDDQATKTQGYGLVVGTAAATVAGGTIKGNDLRGNLTGGGLFTNTPTTHVAGNPGYTPPAPAAVALAASPATYTAPDYPTVLNLTGGTVGSITVGGVAVAASSERQLLLEPGDAVVVTYTAAPTVTTRAR